MQVVSNKELLELSLKTEVSEGAGDNKRLIQVRQGGGCDQRSMTLKRGKLLDLWIQSIIAKIWKKKCI